mgnify:FL=1
MTKAELHQLEVLYGGPLPHDYQQFLLKYTGPADLENGIAAQSSGPGSINPHYLWTASNVQLMNDSLRAKGQLTENQLAFGEIGLAQLLLYQRLEGQWSPRVFLWDEENDWYFHLYSIQYTQPHSLSADAIMGIDSIGFENQDISEIQACQDCLYLYALSLQNPDYEDFFMKEREEKALSIFRTLATVHHPNAASSIASHFEFQEEVESDSVIVWREKAIQWGKVEDNYELADFILDYRADLISRAIQALESLLSHKGYAGRGALKLSRLYMRHEGAFKDLEKGLQLVRQSAAAGNLNAKADLSFYYYKGIGVERNLQKALDFLIEANEQSKERFDGGMWDEEIELIKREMKK